MVSQSIPPDLTHIMDIVYSELWFLEAIVNCEAAWLPFPLLPDTREGRRKGFSEQWNMPVNGLNPATMGEVLWTLIHRGELKLGFRIDDGEWREITPDSSKILAELLASECSLFSKRKWAENYHYVTITPAGIARWETYAIPDWMRYRGNGVHHTFEPGEVVWHQAAATEEFAREVLEVIGMHPFHPVSLHWDKAVVTITSPWEAMRGKYLPHGVTVSVPVTQYEQRSFPCEEWCNVESTHKEYYRRFGEICHWYERSVMNHPDRPLPLK
jgi:hypothetical protein